MEFTFSWYDYTFFILLLCMSVGIGIYFGCVGQTTHNEYLLGGKKMGVFPVAISLIASHISGITLLAIPADVYSYGGTILWSIVASPIIVLFTAIIFLPVFYELEITSVYEYLEQRFDVKTRMYGSFLYGVSQYLLLPIVIYIPALAFSTATGINVHFITPIVCGICIFYTTIGGVKAVIWTDTMQFIVTIGAIFTIFILGLKSAGGVQNVIETSRNGSRLNLFDFNPDLTRRDSFWAVMVGFTFTWISHSAANQGSVQKYLTLPSLRKAQLSVMIYMLGFFFVSVICYSTGLIMYTKYSNCDPYSAGLIKAKDGLIQYYILDVAGRIPGLPGLFTAGVFSAALSTLSANLNCLAGTIHDDFLCKIGGYDPSPKSNSAILKLLVIIIGISCTLLVFVVEKMGGLFPLIQKFQGATSGAMLALFFMGVLMPFVNSNGAFYGSLIATILQGGCTIMTNYYQSQGLLIYKTKPLSNSGCPDLYNSTTSGDDDDYYVYSDPDFTPWPIFRISYYYYTVISFFMSIAIALVISYLIKFFGNKKQKSIPKSLLSPIIRNFVGEKDEPRYSSVGKAMEIINRND